MTPSAVGVIIYGGDGSVCGGSVLGGSVIGAAVAGGSVFGGAVCFVVVTAEVVVSFVVTVVIDDAEDVVCGEVCDAVVLFTAIDVVTEVVVV